MATMIRSKIEGAVSAYENLSNRGVNRLMDTLYQAAKAYLDTLPPDPASALPIYAVIGNDDGRLWSWGYSVGEISKHITPTQRLVKYVPAEGDEQ